MYPTGSRHRKPWHQLTEEEQMIYVKGFKQLRSNGQLQIFLETHHLADTPLSFANVHFTANFFPWHSYFLTEIESQIRNLGDEYKCFALPYWDFTNDAGYTSANDMPIYNSVLGQDGNEEHDFCVEDELWSRDTYPTTYLCSDNEISLGLNCCLKRHVGERGHIPDALTLAPHIYSYKKYRNFQDAVVKEHTYVHGYISGNNNATHMFGHNAAEDPLFILLHNFLMYLRALRTTCFGYDKVINELEEYQPYSYDPYQSDREADIKPFLDISMDFNVLAKQEWSRAYNENITVRKVFDLQYFDISYELGSFWHNDEILQRECGDNLNETWFYNTEQYDAFVDEVIINGIHHTTDNEWLYLLLLVVLFLYLLTGLYMNGLCEKQMILLGNEQQIDDAYGTFRV